MTESDLPRVRWELTPVTAERVQEEFDRAIDLYVDISPLYANQTKSVLRDILSELTPLQEKDDQGAGLIHQAIPDVVETEPRLSARERVVKAATHAYVHGKTSPLVDYVYLAAAREAILVAKERLQRAYDERLTTRRLIPHDEYLEGSADGRGHQLAIIEALIIEIGSGIHPSSAKRSDGTRRSEAL